MNIQMQSWNIIIQKISAIIKGAGNQPKVINIDARRDPNEQYAMYMHTCEMVKGAPEVLVTTGLPGEERIFWPNQDVQFYILEDGRVKSTGNRSMIERIFST